MALNQPLGLGIAAPPPLAQPIGKRGYNEDEVDAFLDLVETELTRKIEESVNAIAGISQLPFTSDQVSTAITGVIAVIASVYAWWRNNNLTGAAVQGQQLTNAIKANIIATDTDATTGTAQAAYAVSDSKGADATADVAPIEEVSYGDGE